MIEHVFFIHRSYLMFMEERLRRALEGGAQEFGAQIQGYSAPPTQVSTLTAQSVEGV